MNDRNLVRGLYLVAVSLAFGITAATHYPIGDFARAGPGLFPLVISSLLLLIGIATVVRARYVPKVHLDLHFKNIGLVIGALIAFSLLSHFVNMIVGIVAMVFIVSYAGTNPSWKRNVKIAIGLVLMALALAKGLGVNLPLY